VGGQRLLRSLSGYCYCYCCCCLSPVVSVVLLEKNLDKEAVVCVASSIDCMLCELALPPSLLGFRMLIRFIQTVSTLSLA